MATYYEELTFHCDNDCKMEGCPSHKMEAEHQTTSDWFTIKVDGQTIYGGDDNRTRAMLKLIEKVDYQ